MVTKSPVKKPRTVNQRFTSLEGLVRAGFRQVDARFRQVDARFSGVHLEFRNLRKEINERFTEVEGRIDRLATHVDGFMKLHETLDIEMRVMKEQMNRFEERLKHLEASQVS